MTAEKNGFDVVAHMTRAPNIITMTSAAACTADGSDPVQPGDNHRGKSENDNDRDEMPVPGLRILVPAAAFIDEVRADHEGVHGKTDESERKQYPCHRPVRGTGRYEQECPMIAAFSIPPMIPLILFIHTPSGRSAACPPDPVIDDSLPFHIPCCQITYYIECINTMWFVFLPYAMFFT
jgi:hypothetical protein